MQLHAPVEVRNHYDGGWAQRFRVVEERPGGFRVQRLSDGAVLPEELPTEDVRAANE
jgi:hypothetical protein